MKITVTNQSGNLPYRAECDQLPGCPPAGEGRTPVEATAVLFARLAMFDDGIWLAHLRTALKEEPQVTVVRQDSPESISTWAAEVCKATAFKTAAYPRTVEVQTAQWDAAVLVAKDWLAQQGLPIPERE